MNVIIVRVRGLPERQSMSLGVDYESVVCVEIKDSPDAGPFFR
jgi:hypothetical protein